MAISEKDIFESLMKDPNHAYNPIGKVWAEAQQRARQFRNNEKALALAFEEPSALSKLENFLTKADGNVEPEDMPPGFDTSNFYNDYTNLERPGADGIEWAEFQNKYKNFTPYIHRVFGLNLDDEDSPEEEDYISDTDLFDLVNLLDSGEPVPDKAPDRAKEEPAEPSDTPEVEAEVPEETPSLNAQEEEHLQDWLDNSVHDITDHKEIREGIINQLNQDGFEQLREENMAWGEILQRAQAANLVPEFPSEEPSLDEPQPQAESLLDEPAEEEDAEEEVKERPNFSNRDDPKAETYHNNLEASEDLPTRHASFTDSQGITWASLKAMNDYLFDVDNGLFSQQNIDGNHTVYSESDVKTDESLGDDNWPIADTSGIITGMTNIGRSGKAGNIRDRLRSSYLRYFNENKAENADDNYAGLIAKMQHHMGQRWVDTINRLAGSKNLSDSDKEAINNVVQNTPEERLVSRDEMTEWVNALQTQADSGSPKEQQNADVVAAARTALSGNSDILNAIEDHLTEEEDRGPKFKGGQEPRQIGTWGPMFSEDFTALTEFIPTNARIGRENSVSLRNTVRDYGRLMHLRSTILRLNAGGRGVTDEDLTAAYTTSRNNTLFKTDADGLPVLSDDIQKNVADAGIQLGLMRLTKKKFDTETGEVSEPNYTRRLSRIQGQIPFIPRTKARNESDAAFAKRIDEAADRQAIVSLNYNNEIKPVDPPRARTPQIGRGEGSANLAPAISQEQDANDAENQLRSIAAGEASDKLIAHREKNPDLTDEEAHEFRQSEAQKALTRLRREAANPNQGEQTIISQTGEEIIPEDSLEELEYDPNASEEESDALTPEEVAALETDETEQGSSYDEIVENWTNILRRANNGSPLSLEHLLKAMTTSLVGKIYSEETPEGRASERYVIAKKFNDDGSINPFWQGRTIGTGKHSRPRNETDGIDPILHPNFEGEEIRELQKAGLVIPQGPGRWASGTNYKWTDEGKKLQGVISSMPRVSKVGETDPQTEEPRRGRNGLIPNDFIPALIALHKSGGAFYHPSYEHEEKLFHDSLRTNGNGEDVSDEEVVEEPIVNEDGTSEGGTLDNSSDVVVNGDGEGDSNLDSPEDIDAAHQNPDAPESGATLEHLYALGPMMNGQSLFPRDANGDLFDPTKGDMDANYTTLMDMFHDLWDRHNPESIQRKYGKHSLDGHPYVNDKGKEFPPEMNPFFYRINPTEEGFDTHGYNQARKQAGLLEGWLNVLQKHLDAPKPGEYPSAHIYADTTGGTTYTSNHNAPNSRGEQRRDDLKIQATHWAWLDAMMGLGFTYTGGEDEFVGEGYSDPNEWVPLFHIIPHEGHKLGRDAGHGFTFEEGDAFPGLLEKMLGEHGDWFNEQEEEAKTKFLEEFGRPPVDPETGRRPHGEYGKGAEEGSFAQAWRSYQSFLGNSPDRWGPTGVEPEERRRKAEEFPFMKWVQDVLDDNNPEGFFTGNLSDVLQSWVWNRTIRSNRKVYETENDIPVYSDRAVQVPLLPPPVVEEELETSDPETSDPETLDPDKDADDDEVYDTADWRWEDNPEELSGEWKWSDPRIEATPMPEEPPQDIQRRNKRIKDILVEEYGEDWKGHPHVADEIESLMDMSASGKLDGAWDSRVVQARKKKRDAKAVADAKEEEKKSNESPGLSKEDRDRMLKEIQEAYKEQHGTELDPRQQSLLLNYAQTNPDQFMKEHANEIKRAALAREKQVKSVKEFAANNINGHGGIPSLAGRSDLRTEDLVAQARIIEAWREQHFNYMGAKERSILDNRLNELHQLAANAEDFDLDAEIEKGKEFAKENDLEYGSEKWLNEIGKHHSDEMVTNDKYKQQVSQGGDLRANRNYKPWLVVKYDENGNGTLCDVREKDINGDWGKPIEGGKRALQFDDDQHYFDYKKDPEDLAQHANAADHFWTNKLDYANLRPHDGKGGVEDVAEFASHKGMLGERGAIGGWYHPESGAWINPHRYNDVRSELEGAGEGSGMAILSGEAYHGSHRADGKGEVNPRYGFAGRGAKQTAKLGNDDLSYYIDGQGNIAHAHGDWNQVQQRDNNQVQSVNDVIHDWHSQNMYNMATNYPDSFKDESGNVRAGTVLRPPQAQAPQPLQNADLFKEVKEGDALERRRARANMPIRENVYGSGLGEDELAGTGQFWSEPQEWKQKFNDVLSIADDIPFVPIASFFLRRIANIKNFGVEPESEKVIRRVRSAYKIHANTQKKTKKNMDDLSTPSNPMRYLSPGESLARKEDTKALRTHLEKERRRLMRESSNQMLDDATRKRYQQQAMDKQAERDAVIGLNPDLDSHWKQIDTLHKKIFGEDTIQDNLVPHASEGVGTYANRLAQPLPSVQQPDSYPSPVSGLLGDDTSAAPQTPKIRGLLDVDEPVTQPQQDLNPPEANEAPKTFRNPPYEGGGEQQAPKAPITGLLG